MRDPLAELATVPPVPLHPTLLAARGTLATVVADLLAIPDAALERRWRWLPSDIDELDVRYGVYRLHERLEEASTAISQGRAEDGRGDGGRGERIGPAIPGLGTMAAARWELHGLLAPLSDDDWNADPGGGEWTIRQTLGHVVAGQRSYSWSNAWFLTQGAKTGEADRPPEGSLPPLPDEEAEAAGTPSEVRVRLDEVVDASIEANAGLDADAMQVGARWMGMHIPIAFRLVRYGSHIREHTIQVDKTLALLGRQPTEVARLVRLILGSYGRLEAQLVGRSAAELERPFADGSDAPSALTSAMADVAATAAQVRETAAG